MDKLQPPIKGDRPKADWGRAVVDAINNGRVTGGGGVVVSEDTTGTVIHAKKRWPAVRNETEPMPFDVDVDVDVATSLMSVSIYIPHENDDLVRRNGHAVGVPSVYGAMTEPAWIALDVDIDSAATRYVWLTVDKASGGDDAWYAGEEGAEWSLHTGATMPSLSDKATRQQTPVLLAVVVAGVVMQVHRGEVETFYDSPDSELDTPINKSLAHSVSGKGVGQIFGFDVLTGGKTVYDLQGATIRDFILRFDLSGGTAMVAYANGEVVAGYVLPQDTVTKWDVEASAGKLVQYQAKWDVGTRAWVKDAVTTPTEIMDIPAADGLPDGTWVWGRIAYDQTDNKFVQYKLIWNAATRTFAESAAATDIIAGDSHSSQHT